MTGEWKTTRGRAVFATLLFVLVVGTSAKGSSQQAANRDSPEAKKSPPAQAPKSLEVLDAEHYLAHVAEFHGKPLMVTFWATWCEPCREEYPMVIELVREYAPKGLSVFGMNLDDDAEEPLALRFVAKTQPVFTNYRKKPGKDQEFIESVNPKWSGALPATFFYDPDGHLVGQLVGEHPRTAFITAIESTLATSAKK